jgi:hypothetical protein
MSEQQEVDLWEDSDDEQKKLSPREVREKFEEEKAEKEQEWLVEKDPSAESQYLQMQGQPIPGGYRG